MKPGDAVKYRSIAGDLHDAVVRAIRDDGHVDLDVRSPCSGALVPVSRIAVRADPGRGECRPA